MNNNAYICVLDTETSGTDYKTNEVVEIACRMIDPHTLEFVPDSEFESLMKPVNIFSGTKEEIKAKWDKCWKAWEVNKKTFKELEKAPLPQHVWKAFVTHVKKYNTKGWSGKPILAGQNLSFDMGFINKACEEYKLGNDLFNKRVVLDTLNLSFLWYDHIPDTPESLSFDTIRPWLGLANDNFHGAKTDVDFTGEYIIRILKLHRHYAPKVKFKGSFANAK